MRYVCPVTLIGERERANLVVQLAQFFLYICLSCCISRFYDFTHAATHYTVNRSNFMYTVSHACASIYRLYAFVFTGLYSRSLYYSCQVCVLLACASRVIQLFSVLQLAALRVVGLLPLANSTLSYASVFMKMLVSAIMWGIHILISVPCEDLFTY